MKEPKDKITYNFFSKEYEDGWWICVSGKGSECLKVAKVAHWIINPEGAAYDIASAINAGGLFRSLI